MRATIRTIAEEAGVSHVTVSHVLRGVGSRASEETRGRVLEAARRLNYIPVKPPTAQNHHIATQVVTFVPEHHDDAYYELDLFTFQGLVDGAREHGYDVLMMVRHEAGGTGTGAKKPAFWIAPAMGSFSTSSCIINGRVCWKPLSVIECPQLCVTIVGCQKAWHGWI